MKKLLLMLCLLVVANAWSQESPKISKNPKDTSFVYSVSPSFNKQLPVDNMPNALQGKQDKLVYRGNNSQGFDLYQSSIDNMMVLKPDANNASSLNRMNNALIGVGKANPKLKMTLHDIPTIKQIAPDAKDSTRTFKLEQLPLKN